MPTTALYIVIASGHSAGVVSIHGNDLPGGQCAGEYYLSRKGLRMDKDRHSDEKVRRQLEEQQAAQTATNLSICTAAINRVENALIPGSKGSSAQFVDSMKVYVGGAIAQLMISGPGTVLPSLPPRPNCQSVGGKIPEKAAEKQLELPKKSESCQDNSCQTHLGDNNSKWSPEARSTSQRFFDP